MVRARHHNGPMDLPVMPPVAPMLAKAVKTIPTGDLTYEPKWDGFRSIIFRDGDEVEIGSRKERPMTRYFPEVVEAVRANVPERAVIDCEGRQGRNFVASGPDVDELEQVNGEPAVEPVRVYAGLQTADTAEERMAVLLS